MKNTKREMLSFLIIVILFRNVISVYILIVLNLIFVDKKGSYIILDKFLIY